MLILDQLRVANWMRSQDGAKGRNRPKPISPLSAQPKERRIGGTHLSDEEVVAMLAAVGPQRPNGNGNGNQPHNDDEEVAPS